MGIELLLADDAIYQVQTAYEASEILYNDKNCGMFGVQTYIVLLNDLVENLKNKADKARVLAIAEELSTTPGTREQNHDLFKRLLKDYFPKAF